MLPCRSPNCLGLDTQSRLNIMTEIRVEVPRQQAIQMRLVRDMKSFRLHLFTVRLGGDTVARAWLGAGEGGTPTAAALAPIISEWMDGYRYAEQDGIKKTSPVSLMQRCKTVSLRSRALKRPTCD